MANPTQASQQVVTPEDNPSITHISHSPSLPIVPKTLEAASISSIPQSQASPRFGPANLPDKVLQLQGQMTAALEQLLTTKASIDSHCRELMLNAKLAMQIKEAQAMEAIKGA